MSQSGEGESDAFAVAHHVRRLREAMGITQKQLAQRAQTSRSAIARIETGVTLPTIPTLQRIAEALDAELLLTLASRAESMQGQSASSVTSGPRIAVFIADSQTLFAESLASALARIPDLSIQYLRPMSHPTSGLETAEAIARITADVVLIDYWMADMQGPALIRSILGWAPQTKVLVLSWLHGTHHIQEALKAGAVGFLPKSLSVPEVAQAIRRAHSGQGLVYGEGLAGMVDAIEARGDEAQQLWQRLSALTPKEVDVLRVLSGGRPMNEVARALSITPGTLRKHLENIMSKTEAASRMEAVAMARRAGLIQG